MIVRLRGGDEHRNIQATDRRREPVRALPARFIGLIVQGEIEIRAFGGFTSAHDLHGTSSSGSVINGIFRWVFHQRDIAQVRDQVLNNGIGQRVEYGNFAR